MGTPERVVYIETKDKAPREFYISKRDVEGLDETGEQNQEPRSQDETFRG